MNDPLYASAKYQSLHHIVANAMGAIKNSCVAVTHAEAGKLKALAASGGARWKGMPDVPTVGEVGVVGFDVRSSIGLAAPPGTPRPIRAPKCRSANGDLFPKVHARQ
jgi:tripartite-type tricarboxylate transporter receptor subunit TctC